MIVMIILLYDTILQKKNSLLKSPRRHSPSSSVPSLRSTKHPIMNPHPSTITDKGIADVSACANGMNLNDTATSVIAVAMDSARRTSGRRVRV